MTLAGCQIWAHKDKSFKLFLTGGRTGGRTDGRTAGRADGRVVWLRMDNSAKLSLAGILSLAKIVLKNYKKMSKSFLTFLCQTLVWHQ